jgi:hypothetical protein
MAIGIEESIAAMIPMIASMEMAINFRMLRGSGSLSDFESAIVKERIIGLGHCSGDSARWVQECNR